MITITLELLESLLDDEDCDYDHHGGCQAHGYLTLEKGQRCPQEEARELLALSKPNADLSTGIPCAPNSLSALLARQFHDAYERLAPSYGYETRPDTRDFDPNSPNGRLMTAVCKEIIKSNADLSGQ